MSELYLRTELNEVNNLVNYSTVTLNDYLSLESLAHTLSVTLESRELDECSRDMLHVATSRILSRYPDVYNVVSIENMSEDQISMERVLQAIKSAGSTIKKVTIQIIEKILAILKRFLKSFTNLFRRNDKIIVMAKQKIKNPNTPNAKSFTNKPNESNTRSNDNNSDSPRIEADKTPTNYVKFWGKSFTPNHDSLPSNMPDHVKQIMSLISNHTQQVAELTIDMSKGPEGVKETYNDVIKPYQTPVKLPINGAALALKPNNTQGFPHVVFLSYKNEKVEHKLNKMNMGEILDVALAYAEFKEPWTNNLQTIQNNTDQLKKVLHDNHDGPELAGLNWLVKQMNSTVQVQLNTGNIFNSLVDYLEICIASIDPEDVKQ